MPEKYSVAKGNQAWWVKMAGRFIVETFKTEEEAIAAMADYKAGSRTRNPKWECWIVGDSFVIEPYIGGNQIGEVGELDLRQFEVTKTISQESFDAWLDEYFEEHGDYPDT
jgi:hypothetical protein